uniref:Large ribosomal subunit protein uL6m n=1 Tax=Reclinomonas americana TaxID=48483 RepID=RM06_RECAM|nr:ribosomal protein L6 [Reclinomonas americana]O21255.1 RecName: Full=Large ribosomal subunit protein uL6m; AltName: Full=60S ribosomal protein L6, mitochondrial [Reclinomonas americana]AAD11882.1 ribosomal protein L6 [Reclinomonas americana]
MSHIGSKQIKIPKNVSIDLSMNKIYVRGDLGKLELPLNNINIHLKNIENDQFLILDPINTGTKKQKTASYIMWGTYRTLIENMLIGVSKGYSKTIELVGVGYKAQLIDKKLVLKIGFSIEINYEIPSDIKVDCSRSNIIVISGIDKQKVNQVAAEIRLLRKPEPYKGKGIRYLGEVIRLKEGKKK